ncbi:uncharacterized protein MONBRDRAFT_32307 [Monosiga brevicollis MX1]|uniref:GOLD domain-containing protein n=1 Tax=Monosiga brevicollis TaxID=81824 RepID=A9UYP7_MONBE|nr:uncharacterized protein MONBRDRAFT_32307 [Monosiga brevicollis MX1]EDQ89500.1 predicted protein [Monosiga brevicollis MX1]|eukprot:XP_001745529.1 hypothetical protein [Monosiga brevicollis MX1]
MALPLFSMRAWLAVACGLLMLSTVTSGMSFTLKGDSAKCLQEDVEKDVLVVGNYKISSNENVDVTLEVNDAQHTDVEITLTVKMGAEARSYQELGKAEKLKPMELSLRKLEDMSNQVLTSFQHLKELEASHRDTNEQTAERMLYFSIFSMVVLVVLAVGQIVYLRRYFQQKKLI